MAERTCFKAEVNFSASVGEEGGFMPMRIPYGRIAFYEDAGGFSGPWNPFVGTATPNHSGVIDVRLAPTALNTA